MVIIPEEVIEAKTLRNHVAKSFQGTSLEIVPITVLDLIPSLVTFEDRVLRKSNDQWKKSY